MVVTSIPKASANWKKKQMNTCVDPGKGAPISSANSFKSLLNWNKFENKNYCQVQQQETLTVYELI